MNYLTWTDKYKPNTISDLVCNRKSVNIIIDWLRKYNMMKGRLRKLREISQKKGKKKIAKSNEYKSSLLLIGNHGVGKTISVKVILNSFNYDIIKLDFSRMKGKDSNMLRYITNLSRTSDIVNSIHNRKRNNVAVFIDELESITSNTEKACIKKLLKLNQDEWFFPIILISNSKHNKQLNDLKKLSQVVLFYLPFPSDLERILVKVTKNENIAIQNRTINRKIIEHSQLDIRRLIYILQEIKLSYGNIIISKSVIDNYINTSVKKDKDPELFETTKDILFNYRGIDDCLTKYGTEKVILPLMIHHNYHKSLEINYDEDESYDILQKISNSISQGDVIENYIYGDQSWNLQSIHGFYTCVIPSFYLNENLDDYQDFRINFSSDLNKTSIKKINRKNIINANKCFKNSNIFDYIYINKIIKHMKNNGQIEECVNMMINYGIKLEYIESLLKIDKIKKDKTQKTNLTTKEKVLFRKYLGEDGK